MYLKLAWREDYPLRHAILVAACLVQAAKVEKDAETWVVVVDQALKRLSDDSQVDTVGVRVAGRRPAVRNND